LRFCRAEGSDAPLSYPNLFSINAFGLAGTHFEETFMSLLRFASAACLAASFALVSPARAAPFAAPGTQPSGQNLVVPVHACHSDVRRAYVPEFGRTTTHRHLRNCRPVRVDSVARDCHSDVRRHFVPGYGQVVHRHLIPSCRIRIYRRYDRPGGRECVRIGPIRYCIY
jgi:hypothetical protein